MKFDIRNKMCKLNFVEPSKSWLNLDNTVIRTGRRKPEIMHGTNIIGIVNEEVCVLLHLSCDVEG
jgi:hypothetical protein